VFFLQLNRDRVRLERVMIQFANSALLDRSVQIRGWKHQVLIVSYSDVVILDRFIKGVDLARHDWEFLLLVVSEKLATLVQKVVHLDPEVSWCAIWIFVGSWNISDALSAYSDMVLVGLGSSGGVGWRGRKLGCFARCARLVVHEQVLFVGRLGVLKVAIGERGWDFLAGLPVGSSYHWVRVWSQFRHLRG